MYQQPVMNQQVVVVVDNQPKEWRHGLFDCFHNCGNCVFAYFLLPCFCCCKYSTLVAEDPLIGRSCFEAAACEAFNPGFCLCFCCDTNRTKIRKAYNIEGSCVNDVLAKMCCFCCSELQEAAELEERKQGGLQQVMIR